MRSGTVCVLKEVAKAAIIEEAVLPQLRREVRVPPRWLLSLRKRLRVPRPSHAPALLRAVPCVD